MDVSAQIVLFFNIWTISSEVAPKNSSLLCREFCKMVKKIIICTCEEAKKMNPRNKLLSPRTGDVASCMDSELKSET